MAKVRNRRFSLKERRQRQRLQKMSPLDALMYLVSLSWSLHHPDQPHPEPGTDPALDHRMQIEAEHLREVVDQLGLDIDSRRTSPVDALALAETYIETWEMRGRTVPTGGFAQMVAVALKG
ncbi:MAG: hypothetical protein ACI9MC_000770 [Kiritimatiellia bacterium]|jgi:hypothetical protein